jgi:PGDYG protein
MIREYINIVESMDNGITDEWFAQGSFETYKHPTPIHYKTAIASGTIETLEGPVDYQAGHKIITGPKGEQYPVNPKKFAEYYDDNKDGTATPKKIFKHAKLADHDGVVKASWGDLNYKAGEDYIVRHGAGDYGVVKKDIFAQTYDTSKIK